MAGRDEVISFCDELLDAGAFDDYCPNGLQVPGGARVEHVATGVSAHLELISRSVEAGADLLIAHHGLFWKGQPLALSERMAERLRVALGRSLSVAGYHLPLDAHPEIGNNALLCERLGLAPVDRFATAGGQPIGIVGTARDGLAAEELLGRLAELLGREPLRQGSGPERLSRVGICSGAGADFIGEAIDRGLDALITGEPAERVMAEAEEAGIHFIAAGHYATETFGVRRLGELVAEEFGVRHTFIDVPNPV